MKRRITLLSGGVGGAKLALGFYHLPPSTPTPELTIISNSGDDISLFGLRICPDSDILAYTLAGIVDEARGWGMAGETFAALSRIKALGGEGWFNLGDADLGLHLFRTGLLAGGMGLAEATRRITGALGLSCAIIPMCEEPVASMLMTSRGELHLQEYLVKHRARPEVRRIRFEGIENSRPSPGIAEALAESDLIVIAPSNPLISIGPILAVPGMRELLARSPAPKVAVSPIVGGKSLKGPSARMLAQLGHEVSPAGVAGLYRGVPDLFVLDEQDRRYMAEIEEMGMDCRAAATVMEGLEDKKALAALLLDMAEER